MIFCGGMLCADIMSVPCTPTDIDNITKVELSDGWYDDLRITKNVTEELSSKVNQIWDWDTILHAKFDNSTSAGNVNWNFETVSHVLIKRKKVDDFKWITLEVHKVSDISDFNLKNIDITATPNYKYQYAAVPILNGVEGFYSIAYVDVKINCLMIADKDAVWCTNITDNYLDNTSVVPNGLLTTMYDRYPTIIRNTDANYEEITINAQFFPVEDDNCTIDLEDDKKRIEYNNKAKMFLRNGNGKILKSMDGNIWMCYVNNPPQDTAQDNYKNRKLSFGVVEIGDPNNEEDLYDIGISDVPQEWWNR